MGRKKNTIEKFWNSIQKQSSNDCWLWMGPKAGGYGNFSFEGMNWRTHRFMYYITYGLIPKDIYVCHKCDNPPCCNPEHLFLGTQKDNIQDCIDKKRFTFNFNEDVFKGESNPRAQLDESVVRAIRKEYALGICSYRDLGDKYNTTRQNIELIVNRKAWKHVV